MGRNLQLCLATLIILSSFPQANNQAVVFKTETCFNQAAPCSIQNLTCSDDERIVILDEQQAFSNDTATCNDRCALECCQEGNFQCLNKVSGKSFSRTFSDCWNKTSCQYKPLQEERVFTSDSHCRSGSSQFGKLLYSCTKESSVRDFTDTTPAVGNLLMAVFSSSRTYPACVSPNSTLQCLVESEPGGAVAPFIRVMLVVNHSTPGNCSKLQVTTGSYKSPDVPCSSYTEYIVVDNVYLEAQTYLVLQVNNEKDEAWAVIQSGQMLRMTCGETCSSTTAVSTSSSPPTLPSSTVNTPQPAHTPTEPSSMTPQNSSMPSPSNSVSQSVSTTTTGLGRTSMETGGGEAITTPVIATLAVLSVLLATALCVAVCVILRQRRTQADDTYARTLPVSAEERTYASLHADPGPRPQVVSPEPLSDAQPEPAPARGGHPREPHYENMV